MGQIKSISQYDVENDKVNQSDILKSPAPGMEIPSKIQTGEAAGSAGFGCDCFGCGCNLRFCCC